MFRMYVHYKLCNYEKKVGIADGLRNNWDDI